MRDPLPWCTRHRRTTSGSPWWTTSAPRRTPSWAGSSTTSRLRWIGSSPPVSCSTATTAWTRTSAASGPRRAARGSRGSTTRTGTISPCRPEVPTAVGPDHPWLCESRSISDPLGFTIDPGWRFELGLSISGIQTYFPRRVVDDSVVVAAQQGEVVQAGGAAVGPVSEVVGVAHQRWSGAAGEGAVPVADDQGGPERGGDQAVEASDVEDLALGAEDGGDDLGVTGQPAQHLGRQVGAVGGGPHS